MKVKAKKPFQDVNNGNVSQGDVLTVEGNYGRFLVDNYLAEEIEVAPPLSSSGEGGKPSLSPQAGQVSQESKPKKRKPRKKPAKSD